jgi:hypothetical protein
MEDRYFNIVAFVRWENRISSIQQIYFRILMYRDGAENSPPVMLSFLGFRSFS